MTADAERADVVILGGGPAGAAAASLLAAWGRRVTVIARASPAPELAESIPPSCERLLDRIGVLGAVDASRFIRCTGNTVWWGAGEGRVESFGGGRRGYQLPRAAFDDLLLLRAEGSGARVVRDGVALEVALAPEADLPGAHLPGGDLRGAGLGKGHLADANVAHASLARADLAEADVARRRAPGGSAGWGALVDYEAAGERRTIAARWVLDCTGRAGLIARRGWRRAEPGGRTLAIVGVWERAGGWGLADESHTLVESYEEGWGWSVPVAATRRYFTVMVDPARTAVAAGRELETTYRRELARTRRLGALAGLGRPVEAPWARDASPYSALRVSGDGILLVGDAASFVDPLSSFGIKKALASAWLAAVVVHTSLLDEARGAAARQLFEAREREMYAELARRTAALAHEAAGVFPDGFWAERGDAAADGGDVAGDARPGAPDVDSLRRDPTVLAAFEDLRTRPGIRLRPGRALRRAAHPIVRGNEVVVEPHLFAPPFPRGVRYLRSVDLVTIVDLAVEHGQVPDLYDAYNRAAAPVPLGDFLGALSVLVGKGLLTHS